MFKHLRFLTQIHVPIWLVLIIAVAGWIVPVSVSELIHSNQSRELLRKEALSELVSYAGDVELVFQSASQFRRDLESWRAALSENSTVELVTFLGERAADSQDVMIARNESMNLQEKKLASLSDAPGFGDLFKLFQNRNPVWRKYDINSKVVEYKMILPAGRQQYTATLLIELTQWIATARGAEDVMNGLSEELQRKLSSQ